MITIATDLDRTLFPNGKQEYDDSMPLFNKLVREKGLTVIYVTGRNIDQIKEGTDSYGPPPAHAAIAEVGTKVYTARKGPDIPGELALDEGYRNHIMESTENWDRDKIVRLLEKEHDLRMQEEHNQNEFKISYYVDNAEKIEKIRRRVEEAVATVTSDAALTTSVDETIGLGLLDIMPRRANKMEGIEYVRNSMSLSADHIIYCGDSGNDLVPLTAGYKAILVANATEEVHRRVSEAAKAKKVEDKLYYARGMDKLNGNYVSGIIEGLVHFNVIERSDTYA